MIDGLWIVRYSGPEGDGSGVVVLTHGRVLGGDSGFTYVGSFEFHNPQFKAKVAVKNFDPTIPSVLGVVGDFDLLIEGNLQGDELNGLAALADAPDAKMVVRLAKQLGL
ncbi:MAG: GrlR family regulatory protein [Candidatus Acidiferrales bacterium]